MYSTGQYTKITAREPAASLYKYTTSLRSITQGKASFTSRFAEYAAVPPAMQEEIIQSHKHVAETEHA